MLDHSRLRIGAADKIPLLPALQPDEALGSWMRRCAARLMLRGGAQEFANGVLKLEGLRLDEGCHDWDTSPPEALMAALARRTALGPEALRRAVVGADAAILRPAQRDAFCPVCAQMDAVKGGMYQRRDWLSAWTLVCAKHGCALGSGAAPLPREIGDVPIPQRQRLYVPTTWAASVHAVPSGAWWQAADHLRLPTFELMPEWKDPMAATSGHWRRLLAFAGDPLAAPLYFAALGVDQTPWEEQEAGPEDVQLDVIPRARIACRLQAARLASLLAWLVPDPGLFDEGKDRALQRLTQSYHSFLRTFR